MGASCEPFLMDGCEFVQQDQVWMVPASSDKSPVSFPSPQRFDCPQSFSFFYFSFFFVVVCASFRFFRSLPEFSNEFSNRRSSDRALCQFRARFVCLSVRLFVIFIRVKRNPTTVVPLSLSLSLSLYRFSLDIGELVARFFSRTSMACRSSRRN